MSTDKELLGKALLRLGILILLFIISPIVITMGFKAFDKFTEAPQIYVAYGIVVIGAFLLLYSMYFAFKTFGVLQKAIFNEK